MWIIGDCRVIQVCNQLINRIQYKTTTETQIKYYLNIYHTQSLLLKKLLIWNTSDSVIFELEWKIIFCEGFNIHIFQIDTINVISCTTCVMNSCLINYFTSDKTLTTWLDKSLPIKNTTSCLNQYMRATKNFCNS